MLYQNLIIFSRIYGHCFELQDGDINLYLWSLTPSGTFTVIPSKAFVMQIWQPSREVSVRPNARSSMSSSSSVASSSIFLKSWSRGDAESDDRLCIYLLAEYEMTRRAGQRPLARSKSVDIKIIVYDNVQKIVSFFRLSILIYICKTSWVCRHLNFELFSCCLVRYGIERFAGENFASAQLTDSVETKKSSGEGEWSESQYSWCCHDFPLCVFPV